MTIDYSTSPQSSSEYSIQLLQALDDHEDIEALCDVLIDCVEGGASVSFMQPLSRAKADAFWRNVGASVTRQERLLLVAREGAGAIIGTVQAILSQPENQPHRGDISKLLVHRRARSLGLGAALMKAAEQAAQAAGKTVLVLDTATGGGAESLYERLGWQMCGRIPDYALWPQGGLCSTTIYSKSI
ncbi:GNAT family N-acetyltransferase [Undibacterium sp. RTI2.1]|uniref:GNAT family N-acetyltransferase n=1 Tax=unclassified Undibacterium TaxID=2630295 RepID=UPI002AB3FFC0|nr:MULTISPECIES: GNAT family N-acetyltransferase [unclassified Undibacterium]MDY7536958.1 GNAT family N-acetyltransferase [Undibacterium sp. 5I1]MEB0032637.1 GNAT family N-acetyltransferase [Undibacterium sp. RTI2.1]MEB0117991.1 GNAT family N-acetyltransferase [Undibacterium sp. RTI2.2]MEB0229510.1 GNAT family N-acetyltransferase [Undibacterium sp. 10I3]MEB0258863.1 GNAT family N-acetyltransferase [Undibacterium sp. 5I1]